MLTFLMRKGLWDHICRQVLRFLQLLQVLPSIKGKGPRIFIYVDVDLKKSYTEGFQIEKKQIIIHYIYNNNNNNNNNDSKK